MPQTRATSHNLPPVTANAGSSRKRPSRSVKSNPPSKRSTKIGVDALAPEVFDAIASTLAKQVTQKLTQWSVVTGEQPALSNPVVPNVVEEMVHENIELFTFVLHAPFFTHL